MAGFFDSLWEIIFPTPRICPLCQKKQPVLGICADCRQKLQNYKKNTAQCARCGTFGVTEENCHNHRGWPAYLKSSRSLWPYMDEYRRVMLDFKFHGQPWLARLLAEILAPLADEQGEIVIPVPISAERLQERGFNQSALVAKNIAEILSLEYAQDVLIKTKNTPRQSTLRYNERRQSLQGALSVKNENKIAGKKIILVDDIFTTGTTIRSCAEVLHHYSQNDIFALTLCSGAG